MSLNQQHLGHYELQQCLGSGAMSEVWKAFDTQQHRYVAIKILHVNPQAAADLIPRFQRETSGLTSLQHPNIASVFEVQASYVPGSSSSEAYMVMDYVEGRSLADYMQTTSYLGNFPSAIEIVQLLAPIASALDYIHQRGVIHGRLKPSNILLDKHGLSENPLGEPRLVGFGMHNMQAPLTLQIEDVYYISPEQAKGNTENMRSDIYSLGVILYELCTGTLPFHGNQVAEVILQHVNAAPTSPALINPRILPALTAVIMRCLAKDPVARFPTVSAMMAALARALNMSVQDIVSQSGSVLRNIQPLSGDLSDPMNSPTYLSPLPQYRNQPWGAPSSPSVANSGSGAWASLAASPQAGLNTPGISGAIPALGASGSTNLSPDPFATVPQSDSTWAANRSGPPSAQMPGHSATGQIPTFSSASSPPTGPPSMPVAPVTKLGKGGLRGWMIALIAVLIVVVLGSGLLGAFLFLRPGSVVQKPIVGHAFFVSSGILSQSSNQGIADKIQVDLQNLPDPQAGKSYYAWLLNDNDSDTGPLPILLGALTIKNGRADITYPGDTQHNDLLANYSRLLVTEENANPQPVNPSLDPSTWRYYSAFSQTPNPADTTSHYSLLDHLRHLLAQDPKLRAAGLTGGLDIWLFRNTTKVLEWSGSARDAYSSQDTGLMRRQVVRILDYLDGSQYIGTENIPSDLPSIEVDQTIARVALLQINPNQDPPGYLWHIGLHLRELAESPGVTPDQQHLAIQINNAINNVQTWLQGVHSDAETLIHMTPDQLKQPQALTVLNHMFTLANYAFVGQTDPNTNLVKEGVSQIHYNDQRLATFDITACTSGNARNPCV